MSEQGSKTTVKNTSRAGGYLRNTELPAATQPTGLGTHQPGLVPQHMAVARIQKPDHGG